MLNDKADFGTINAGVRGMFLPLEILASRRQRPATPSIRCNWLAIISVSERPGSIACD